MSKQVQILIVEDEENVGATLTERLEREGFSVSWVKSIAEATAILSGERRFDLAILDVGLPDGDGFSVGINLKQRSPRCALVFLTAFGSPEERVRGLQIGADDYVVKPFHFNELLLRLRNCLRRYENPESATQRVDEVPIGAASINFPRFQLQKGGEIHQLSQKECQLLKMLYDCRGRVVSRGEMIDSLWAEEEYPTTRTVDNFIVRLRRLVEENPDQPQLIKNIRGVGYMLETAQ